MGYGINKFLLLSYCLACCWPSIVAKGSLKIVNQWGALDFKFPSDADRKSAISKGYYVPGNSVPIDVDVNYNSATNKSRIFLAMPRFEVGRPVTLGTVGDDGLISAYPNYTWHDNQGSNCDGLTSVVRVAIDKCNRLWAMDTGIIKGKRLCSPQLLAFDLNTDQLLFRHRPSNSSYIPTSRFVTPVVDIRSDSSNNCSNTFVYVADVGGFGLLVVDVSNNRSWRVDNKYFYPYPSRGSFVIDGVSYESMDGVIGMALSPYVSGQDRLLYFHALASTTENVVNTSVIRDASLITNSNVKPSSVTVLPGERANQTAAEAMDSKGRLYFGLMEPPSIWYWDTSKKFSQSNFKLIESNGTTLQYASGVKVVTNLNNEEELWVLTSSIQRVITGTLNSNQTNFRIQAQKISVLLGSSKTTQDDTE